MIDILYLAHNRLEFTRASLSALITNTDWSMVSRLLIYDDGSTDGTVEYLDSVKYPLEPDFMLGKFGGPVAIMNDYLSGRQPAEIFAKIDNDTMVPPCWLSECMNVMNAHPELGLLGIEVFDPVVAGQTARSYRQAQHIGGIGLMRRKCFKTLPRPNGRFGFTEWQRRSSAIKGWLNPALPVFLLDRLPHDQFRKLSAEYIRLGWQRPWPAYGDDRTELWEWWCE